MMAEVFYAEDYEVDDPVVAAKVSLLRDADSSQFSAIIDVMDGKNLAVKGAARHGQVADHHEPDCGRALRLEGRALRRRADGGLNVVKSRPEEARLGHFRLELHSTKARKKEVLEHLDKRLSVQNRIRRDTDLEAALKDLTRVRAQLSDYVSTIILLQCSRIRAAGGAKLVDDLVESWIDEV